jgi:Fe-S-cluster containining protein
MSDAVESCLCDQCSALCCRYFVLEIDKPQTRRAYDDIRWYLVHENVFVFIEKRKWYLGIYSRCKHLQPDNRCGIYLTRPQICRDYSTDNCDYHGGEYDWEVLFSSADQLERYAKERLAEAREKQRRQKKREMRAEKESTRAEQAQPQRPPARKPRPAARKLPKLRPGTILGPVLGLSGVAGPRPVVGAAANGRGLRSLPVLRGR